MKKLTKSKSGKSTKSIKTKKAKDPLQSASAAQDIVGLLTMLVQKLSSFEAKLDIILNKIDSQPSAAHMPQQHISAPIRSHRREQFRPMYEVVCMACGKDTQVPFKPSGNRPIYCKECFSMRKNKGSVVSSQKSQPKEEPATVALMQVSKKTKAGKKPSKTTKKKTAKKKTTAKSSKKKTAKSAKKKRVAKK